MKKVDLDTILLNLFVFILIVISLISIVLIRDYVGYAGSHMARGGKITELNIYQIFPASVWNGVFGIALQAPVFNTTWFINAEAAGMSEINPIFTCLEPGETHELYLTTLNTTDINWGNITAGTREMVDSYTGTLTNESVSASQTFNDTITVEVGSSTISNVPATYMYQYNTPGSAAFAVGILQWNGTIIMVAVISDSYLIGYRPDKIFNFEMMVPVPKNASTIKYNIYTDPFDECPQGESGETFTPGDVY